MDTITKNTSSDNSRTKWLLMGVTLGAIAAFYLDPDRGRRRRSLVRDKFTHYSKMSGRLVERKTHHLQNLMHGYFSRLNFKKVFWSGWKENPAEIIH